MEAPPPRLSSMRGAVYDECWPCDGPVAGFMQQDASGNVPAAPVSPEHYSWTAEGKPLTVRLAYSVIERLHVDVMQGFGLVPRRGAEVGGLLLGNIVQDGGTEVVIDDYAPVACEHRHGPSFSLSGDDRRMFAAAVEKWRRQDSPQRYVVGCYRSNTRTEFCLSDEDRALCDEFIPGDSCVFLLIKPFATKACQAAFFFRENGVFPSESPYGTFPFRRQDAGAAPGPEQSRPRQASEPLPAASNPAPDGERPSPVTARGRSQAPAAVPIRPLGRFAVASPGPSPIEERPAAPPNPQVARIASPLETMAPPRGRRSVPLPLAFVFLLLGVLLGFQAALQMRPEPQPQSPETLVRLGLHVVQRGDNLQVNWNRDSVFIQPAQRAVLFIWDGADQKSTELDAATLRSGNVVYRRITSAVSFRLEVFLPSGRTVSETCEWRLP